MADKKYLSILIDRFVPEYVREEYTQFTAFIRHFLEYCEEEGKVYTLVSEFLHFLDLDKLDPYDPYSGDSEVLEEYIHMYLSSFPLYRINDIDVVKLIKNAKDFYSCKGTERSYQFLFRLLNHVGTFSFYYPSNDILTVSHATDGIVSGEKKIHDNYYRAYYTYEIRSTRFGYVELKDIIESLLHPAGCKAFFLRSIQDECELNPYSYDASDCVMVFHHPETANAWSEGMEYRDMYENTTFGDIESGIPIPLAMFTFGDLEDIFYNLESSGNTNYYPFQCGAYRTLL